MNELDIVRHERDWIQRRYDDVVVRLDTYDLVREHQARTMACSFTNHMRKASGIVYEEIARRGLDAEGYLDHEVASVLRYLRDEGGGMSVMLLLWDLTDEDPTVEHQEEGAGFVGFHVEGCRQAWLRWGQDRGLI